MKGKRYIYLLMSTAIGLSAVAQDYFDDIYYNPKKDKTVTLKTENKKTSSDFYDGDVYSSEEDYVPYNSVKKTSSTYIANMADMDVDAYNRRGQYYVSDIDTIGSTVENGDDFVYTQQIQKYYNPTIVVDNASVLGDVLSDSYGNVDIVINDNGYPVFAPLYSYGWPYYSYAWSPWNWGINIGNWGWSVGWYNPWYSWNWGWNWGWNPGPGWGWGPPAPAPGFRPGPMASWSPNGNRPVAPRPGWGSVTRPNIMPSQSRPGGNYRGTYSYNPPVRRLQQGSAPSKGGVVNNNGKWEYKQPATTTPGHRTPGTGILPSTSNRTPASGVQSGNKTTARPGATVNNRSQQSGRNQGAVNNSKEKTTSNNKTSNRSVSNNTRTTTSRSSGVSTSRSSGGRSFGGGGSAGRGGGGGGGRRR